MLNALFALPCLAVWILYLSCFIITSASTQTFTHLSKQYFYNKEYKTVDDAATFCGNRGQRLLQIDSKEENDFIFNSILRPLEGYTWLGASSIVGSGTFKWLDGSEMIYSNWLSGQPNDNINQRNAVYMYNGHADGQWDDTSASGTTNFICETLPKYALKSKILEHTSQLNTSIDQLDSRLESVFSNGTSTLRGEYIEFISDVTQRNGLVRDQMVRGQEEMNRKLNNLSLAIAELSRNDAEVINLIESSVRSVNESRLELGADIRGELQSVRNELSSYCNATNIATEEKLFELIKGQVIEYSYLDKQYVLTREYNNFYSAARVCKNRNESLVQINSRMENEFIFNTIVKPSGQAIWLGASNEIGSNTYKWLNGNELAYANWDAGFPDKDTNEGLNAVLMNQSSGQWYDELATVNGFVLCERPTVFASLQSNLFALHSTVLGQSVTILEQSVTIGKLEQQYKDASNRLDQSQMDVLRFERQANETAIELAFQKRQNAELIAAHDTRLKRLEVKLIKTG